MAKKKVATEKKTVPVRSIRTAKKAIDKTLVVPGGKAMEGFMRNYGHLFSITELERTAKLPASTLRHIRTGTRSMTASVYVKMRQNLLPIICQLAFIMQNYEVGESVDIAERWV